MAIQDFELVKTAFLRELQKMAGMFLRRALPGAVAGAVTGAVMANPELGESRMEQGIKWGLGGGALTAAGGKLLEHQALKRAKGELVGQHKGQLQKLQQLGLSRSENTTAKRQLAQNVRGARSRFEKQVREVPFYGV